MKTNKKFENPNPNCTHSGVLESFMKFASSTCRFLAINHTHTQTDTLFYYIYIDDHLKKDKIFLPDLDFELESLCLKKVYIFMTRLRLNA